MDNNKNKTTTIAIGIACVWMGTHFGPGLASGAQVIQYWVKYGWFGAVASVLAMCLLGYCLYCSMEFSRVYKTYNYGDWIVKVFGVKWVGILFDISFIITCMTALGGSLSAVGNLLYNQFGINYWVGVFAVIIVACLLCAFGAALVAKVSSYMMYLVIAVLAVIVVLTIASGKMSLGDAIANQASNPFIDASPLGALWSAIIYASFQATVIANISSVANQLPNRSTSKKAAAIGICGNSLVLVVMTLFLLGSTSMPGLNVLDTSTTGGLPFYSILQNLGFGWAQVVYVLTVYVAVVSTAVGFSFGGLARFSKFYRKADEKTPGKDALLVAVLLLACAAASRFGLVALVSTGYTILGYVNLPILIIPAIVLAGRKIGKQYLQEHNIDAPGIDE